MDLMTLFVGLTAVAVLGQAIALIAIFVQSRRLSQQVSRFMDETRDLIAPMKVITENLTLASANLVEIGIGVRDQFHRVEAMITDTGLAIDTQIQRFDRMSQEIVERIGQTASIVQDSVVRPVREVSAFAKGISRGFEAFLFRKPRRAVDEARQDEELFI